MTTSAPLIHHRSAPGTCPRCGSASFKRVKAERETALKYDRECKECGTRYMTVPAPMSDTVQAAIYVSGVMVLFSGIMAGLVWLAEMQLPGGMRPGLYSCILPLLMAFSVLRMPRRQQQLREKSLKEYEAAAPPNAPPPVELPPAPDMVYLSVIFGAFSLAALLAAPLFMVVLFGLAAIVCGILALAQGHLKGLIGLVLGVVGLIAGGLVFVYFFLG
jgi:hypothetical protein